jgi:hypothetical protein
MRNTEHRGSDARVRPGGEIGVSREKAVVSLLAGSLGTVCGRERGVNVKRVQGRGTGAGQRVKSE